jgi:starch-binding outer membrane protein SusE/F
MRKILINLSFILGVVAIYSCQKDENRVVLKEPVPANVLSALSATSFELQRDSAANVFQTFKWTDVNFGFDVVKTYTLQVDSAGKKFANPVDVVTVSQLLTTSITIGDFNKALLNMGLKPDVPADLEFRIKAVINNHVNPVFSNTETAMITPFALTFPPIFMCGAATGGWDWGHGIEMRSTAPSVYQTIAYFLNNQTFRFFKQHDWGPTSYNYPFFDGGFVSDSLANANDGDKNFNFLAPTGYYVVTVNLNTKAVTLQPTPEPMMFMTGAALGGWDWDTHYVKMTWISNGMFEATANFINGQTFRFFGQKDWSPVSYNFPYFAGGTVDPLFENANDGDKNFKFTGTTGSYKISLNMLDKIIVMVAQ